MKSIVGYEKPLVSPPSTYKGNFMEGKYYYTSCT